MSDIDIIPHQRVGLFGRIPIYLCLEDGCRLGRTGEQEPSSCARKMSFCIGGGSGEHPAAVLNDLAGATRAYLEYVTTGETSERPEIIFCAGMTLSDWENLFKKEYERHTSDIRRWIALCLGEFIAFMLPTITESVSKACAAHRPYLLEATPYFEWVTIPWDTYHGNGRDYFKVIRQND